MPAPIGFCPRLRLAALVIAGLASSGCQWYESLRGDGFTQSTSSVGTGIRNDPSAEASGFFTDRRSDQIERSLGGGF